MPQADPTFIEDHPLSPLGALQLCVLLLSSLSLLDLLVQGLCPELKPGGLQGMAHSRLEVQLQVQLLVIQCRPLGQALAIGVPADIPSQHGGRGHYKPCRAQTSEV